jgi:hypothetical protein
VVGDLLVDDGVVAEVQRQAALRLWDVGAEKARVARRMPEAAVGDTFPLPPIDVGEIFAREEPAHSVTKLLVLAL